MTYPTYSMMDYNPVWRYFDGPRFKGASLAKSSIPEEHALSVLSWLTDDTDFFVLQGSVGVGKTHMALCVADNIFKKLQKKGVQYPSVFVFPEGALFENLSESWRNFNFSQKDELRKISDVEYLFIDDFGSTVGMDWKVELMFQIIDSRSSLKKKTFLTTNLTLSDMEFHFHKRLVDRIYNSQTHWCEWEGDSVR